MLTLIGRRFLLGVTVIAVALSGCIRQEVVITLRADGSGSYRVKRYLNEMEGAAVGFAEAVIGKEAMSEGGAEAGEKMIGKLRRVDIEDGSDPGKPENMYKIVEYHFKSLGEALVDLENEVVLGPRYTFDGDDLLIFLDREKQEFDGMGDNEDKEMFYHLTINLPVPPKSPKGTVVGNSVSWKFDTAGMKKYQQSAIGTRILEARIPGNAVKLDLSPRLFTEKEDEEKPFPGMKKEEEKSSFGLKSFNTRIPIAGKALERSKERNGQLALNFDVPDLEFPVSYEGLILKEVIIGGKKVEAKLESGEKGVVSGKDAWGQKDTPGFPVNISLPVKNPWLEKIDKVSLSVGLSKPTRMTSVPLVFSGTGKPYPRSEQEHAVLKRILVTNVDSGSSAGMLGGPTIELFVEGDHGSILNVYMDTRYGLRYRAERVSWSKKNPGNLYGESKEIATAFFGEKFSLQQGTFSFRTIPAGPFTIILECVLEKGVKTVPLVMENIDVRPEK